MVDLTFFERAARSSASLFENLADRAPYLLLGLVLFLLSWVAAKVVARTVRGILRRVSTAGHVDVLLARVAAVFTFVIGSLVALSAMQIRVTALVTSLGLVGVAVGFALKELVSSWIAGVMLLLQRPFTLGDSIAIGGFEGVVRDVRLRDTVLETTDGRMAYVPNLTVFTSVITNASVNAVRRTEVELALPPGADFSSAIDAALEAVDRLPFVVSTPAPEAAVVGASADAVTIVVRGWVDTGVVGFGDAKRELSLVAARAVLAHLPAEETPPSGTQAG